MTGNWLAALLYPQMILCYIVVAGALYVIREKRKEGDKDIGFQLFLILMYGGVAIVFIFNNDLA